ncbi:MAG: ATP-binding protein, partial [Actinomycetota bacterium]
MRIAGGFKITEVLRRDADLALSRGRTMDGAPVLVVSAATERAGPAIQQRLAHEYALKGQLGPAWAVCPRALHQAGGDAVLVLDDPGGEPLETLLAARGGRPLAGTELGPWLRLAAAAARGLAAMHDGGLIHKNVTPANLMVDRARGTVLLTGFGVASAIPREQDHAMTMDVIVGTFPYMAPEQTGRMNRSVDSRSDLYGLGVTLYETFAGALPFTAQDPMEWVHCHVARPPVPLGERAPEVPAAVAAIVMKLLAKTAEDRYQTAAGVAADLERCLGEWEATGRIAPFPLAAHDATGRLVVPERLYGRETESARLLDAHRRVARTGTPELVLVSGYSGVGKSALVNQIHAAMVEGRGLFGAGKFDRQRRDTPYGTFAQAFHTLIRQILSKAEAEVGFWRQAIQEAVGANGGLVVDLIGQLEQLIGPQAPVPVLSPGEAQVRFLSTFRRFVAVFARPEHPLVLFLDDLQWMDQGSLKLLEHLMTHAEMRNLLLVGSYRDNEVDPAHPLMLTVDAVRSAGLPVCDIVLGPLSADDVGRLVADSLRTDAATAAPLAALVHEKTAGNPFFAIQFLTALVDEHLLGQDPGAGGWRWDMGSIRAKSFSDNVVELMAAKLRRLDDADQDRLRRMACLGNGATLATLAMVWEQSPDVLAAELADVVRAGFVFRSGERMVFAHDRIQEAVYQSIPPAARTAMHLHIGRRMIERLSPAELDEQVFDIVHHLDLGAPLIEDAAERARCHRLNCAAGRRAKASTAIASARTYFHQARAMLPEDAWARDQEGTFRLTLDLAECEYLVGNHDEAGTLFAMLLDQAQSDDQRVQVWRLRFRLYMVAGRFGDAVTIAVEALARFGLACP